MPSLRTLPETESVTVREKEHVWGGSTPNSTNSYVAQMEIRTGSDSHKIFTTMIRSPEMLHLHKRGCFQQPRRIPKIIIKQLLDYIPYASRCSLRSTCKSWREAVDMTLHVTRPVGNIVPADILLQIFHQLSPRDFDNARRSCSQWMRVSLNEHLLETMLKRAGWWDSWLQDRQSRPSLRHGEETTMWKMSRRFATECVLSGRKLNVEKPGFLPTATINFSALAVGKPGKQRPPHYSSSIGNEKHEGDSLNMPQFLVSDCGNYVQVISGQNVYLYRLSTSSHCQNLLEAVEGPDITPIASIECPSEVTAVTMDTSSPTIVIAALMQNRSALVCDLITSMQSPTGRSAYLCGANPRARRMYPIKLTPSQYYYNICSTEDPPHTLAVCPGRRCVAFGSNTGIELRWVDEKSGQEYRKQFPMSQPAETLHFLSNRPETPTELRLISSLAGPEGQDCRCPKMSRGEKRQQCPIHLLTDVRSFTRWNPEDNGKLSMVRATHCHHYRAIPINDGLHILFIEPRTSLLCIGSDAPIGGLTSLTRAFVCMPPLEKDISDAAKDRLMPHVFAAGSDWQWGLRVVAAYRDKIILYSVPLDVFNIVRKERERQGDGVMGDSDLARDWFLDYQRLRKGRESSFQNHNGDWDCLLSVSYQSTARMWPFQIYGKEIGRMNNVVELAIQSSHGGARVWAFGSLGETNIFDIDTFTTTTRRSSDIPLMSTIIGADGRIASIKSMDRKEPKLLSPGSSRKRKQAVLETEFIGHHQSGYRRQTPWPGRCSPYEIQGSAQTTSTAVRRRTSFAACIIDFKIPELGSRGGRWSESSSECI